MKSTKSAHIRLTHWIEAGKLESTFSFNPMQVPSLFESIYFDPCLRIFYADGNMDRFYKHLETIDREERYNCFFIKAMFDMFFACSTSFGEYHFSWRSWKELSVFFARFFPEYTCWCDLNGTRDRYFGTYVIIGTRKVMDTYYAENCPEENQVPFKAHT